MKYFSDISFLESTLTILEEEVQQDQRHLELCHFLEMLGFTTNQAKRYAEIVLFKNTRGSAHQVGINGKRISKGKWVRGEQEGAVGGWLSSMQEHWQFNANLTYVQKIIRSDLGISSGPFFNSSFTNSREKLEEGIWAPSDSSTTEVDIFVLPYGGSFRSLTLGWVEVEKYNYQACTIERKRYSLER